jgi:hypothetical protein
MAARESQGYLIAVIGLVVVTLLLALAAFLGFQKANEYYDASVTADNKLKVAESRAGAFEIQAQILRAYIGKFGDSLAEVDTHYSMLSTLSGKVPESAKGQINEIINSVDEVKKQYDADMRLMIATGAPEQAQEQTWRGLVDNYAAALGKIHSDNNTIQNDIQRINRETKSELAAKDKTVEQTQLALQGKENELTTEKEARRTDVARLQTSLDTNNQEFKNLTDSYETYRKDAMGKEKTLTESVAMITSDRDKIKDRLDEFLKEDFDLADGKIVRVSPGLGIVYLNIGSEDGLRTNQAFSVYDQTVTNFQKDQNKASVEVTKIMGPHQSEARVTLENPINPILENDVILNAVWDPGYSVPIAIAGIFDIDFDGNDDRDRLIQIIARNGGKVVATHDNDGKVKGEIDSSTRYFVVGDSPGSGPDANPEITKAIRELSVQAKSNGVQEIDIRKLLNWMGLHGQAEAGTERMDSEIGEQFKRKSSREANSDR